MSTQSPAKGGGAGGAGISLDNATRDDLIDFVKKQAVHIKKVETAYKTMKKDLTEATQKCSNLEEEAAFQKQMAASVANQLDEINQVFQENHNKFVVEKENTIGFLNEQKKELETLLALHAKEMDDIRGELESKQEEMAVLVRQSKEEIATLQEKLDTTTRDNQTLRVEMETKQEEMAVLVRQSKEEIATLQEKLDSTTRDNEDFKSKTITETTARGNDDTHNKLEHQKMEEKMVKLKNLLISAQKHVSEQKKQIAEKAGEITILNERINVLETNSEENESMASEYHEMKRNFEYYLQRIKILESQLASVSSSYKTLQEEHSEYKIKSDEDKQEPEKDDDDIKEIQRLEEERETMRNQFQEERDMYTSQIGNLEDTIKSLEVDHSKESERIGKECQSLLEEITPTTTSLMSQLANLQDQSNQLAESTSSQDVDSVDGSGSDKETNQVDHGMTFSIEHLLPQAILPKDDPLKTIDLPQSGIPLEVEHILQNYARIQANRDEELRKANLHINQLKFLLNDSEKMELKHCEQEKLLKDEIRNLERSQKREGSSLEYVKNIILKYIEKDDETLIPVLSTLMQFTPDELNKAMDAVKSKKTSSIWKVTSYFGTK
eukprot:gene7906-9282_t